MTHTSMAHGDPSDRKDRLARRERAITAAAALQTKIRAEADATTTNANLKAMNVTDLKAMCKKRGFRGYSKLKKSDLIALLRRDL